MLQHVNWHPKLEFLTGKFRKTLQNLKNTVSLNA